MKNDKNIAVFAAAVKSKVERADAMGTKTSWDVSDHRRALAECIAQALDSNPETLVENAKIVLDVLEDCSNESAFAQQLAKVPAFVAKGHFQRDGTKAKTVSALYAALGVQ